jgi:hypothetical protein
VADNFGGPVWHASARGRNRSESRRICINGLRGVGDASLGQWEHDGEKPGVVHMLRRLSVAEQETFAVPEPFDIRGTDEECARLASVIADLDAVA